MKRIISLILIFSLFISGCSNSIKQESHETRNNYYTRINKIIENQEELFIKTLEGQQYKGKQMQIENDYSVFYNIVTERSEKILTKEIVEIEFDQSGAEGVAAFSIGAVAGGSLTAIFYPPSSGEAMQGRAIAILLGIVVGGLGGILVNNLMNNTVTIKISQ